jgi:cell division GTPase FtsZ
MKSKKCWILTQNGFHHCWNDGWWNGTAAPVIAQLAKERDILTVGL